MSNASDFIIENGVLIECKGKSTELVFPDGIKSIADYSLRRQKDLKQIILPASLEKIGNYALGDCCALEKIVFLGSEIDLTAAVFNGCMQLKEMQFPAEFFSTTKRRPAMLAPFVKELSVIEMAHIWVLQDAKWFATIQQKVSDINEFSLKLLEVIPKIEKFTQKSIDRFIFFLDWAYPEITKENAEALSKAIALRDEKLHKKFLSNEIVSKALEGVRVIEELEPIEEQIGELLKKKPLRPDAVAFTKGVCYAGKDKRCSPLLLNYIASEYLDFYDANHVSYSGFSGISYKLKLKMDAKIPEVSEQIALALNRSELSQALEDLVSSFSKGYRFWMYAYGRFATEESIEKMLRYPPNGPASKVRSWKENLEAALFLSETKVAIEHLEKKGCLEEYANIRGMTLQEFRDRYSLPKWEMDENGIIKSQFGNYGYTVSLDLNLQAMDLDSKKELRTISVKTNPAAAAEFKDLKREAAEFYKKRVEYIRSIYITAEKIAVQNWLDSYCGNPILIPVAEKVIWSDAVGETFMLKNGVISTADGKAYLPQENVKIAHVLEMSAPQIAAWQQYLRESGRKLLIEQVWEPIAAVKNADQFAGITISKEERNELKRVLASKSISLKSDNDYSEYDYRANKYVFSDTGTMYVGSALSIRYQVEEDTGDTTLQSFRINKEELTRELNAILFALGCTCVHSVIRRDDVELLTFLLTNTFTAAQILEFTRFAHACESTQATGILLEYKQAHYQAYDPMAEFTLD